MIEGTTPCRRRTNLRRISRIFRRDQTSQSHPSQTCRTNLRSQAFPTQTNQNRSLRRRGGSGRRDPRGVDEPVFDSMGRHTGNTLGLLWRLKPATATTGIRQRHTGPGGQPPRMDRPTLRCTRSPPGAPVRFATHRPCSGGYPPAAAPIQQQPCDVWTTYGPTPCAPTRAAGIDNHSHHQLDVAILGRGRATLRHRDLTVSGRRRPTTRWRWMRVR